MNCSAVGKKCRCFSFSMPNDQRTCEDIRVCTQSISLHIHHIYFNGKPSGMLEIWKTLVIVDVSLYIKLVYFCTFELFLQVD